MKVRKSISKARKTVTPKIAKEGSKVAKTVKKTKNDAGMTYPPENLVAPDLEQNKVEKAADSLLQLDQKGNKDKISLLGGGEGEPIFLMMSFFKIPNIPRRVVRIDLPNTLLQDTTDVAFIVRDLEPKARHPDHEAVVQLYSNRLRAHGIKHQIKIIPLRLIMTENRTYESKRKLCNSHDVFLADCSIAPRLVPLLGKQFTIGKKTPYPVKTEPSDAMAKSIKAALSKTMVQFSSTGNCRSIKIGHTNMTGKEVAENVMAVVEKMSKEFPGGWVNIRNLFLKTLRCPSIPFYVAIRNPNEVKITGMKRKLKHGAPVQGELTTTDMEDFQVRLTAQGKIEFVGNDGKPLSKKKQLEIFEDFGCDNYGNFIKPDANKAAEEEEEDEAAERKLPEDMAGDEEENVDPEEGDNIAAEEDDEDEIPAKKAKKEKGSKKKKAKAAEESDDEEEEAAVRGYEDAYLNVLEHESKEKIKKEKKAAAAKPVAKGGKKGKAAKETVEEPAEEEPKKKKKAAAKPVEKKKKAAKPAESPVEKKKKAAKPVESPVVQKKAPPKVKAVKKEKAAAVPAISPMRTRARKK